MNKEELAEVVRRESKLSMIQSSRAVDSLIGAIKRELRLKRMVKLEKFGQFKVVHTQALSGRNPRTGAAIVIKAKFKPVFVASRIFRVEINAII